MKLQHSVRSSCLLLLLILVGCGSSSGDRPGSAEFVVSAPIAQVQAQIDDFVLVEVEVNGEVGRFIVDSGADAFVVSRNFANRANLPQVGTAEITTVVGSSLVDVVRLDDFRFANVRASNIEAAVVGALNFDGIIGVPFFRAVIVAIDYQEEVLTLYNPDHFELSQIADEAGGTILSGSDGLVISNLNIDGIQIADVRIDTGSSGGLRLSAIVGQLLLSQATSILPVESSAANGTVSGNAFIVEKVSFDGFELMDQFVVVQDRPLEIGLMGNLILQQFFIVFDVGRGQILMRQDRSLSYALTT